MICHPNHATAFLLSSLVSKKREIKDARRVFQKAKTIAKGKPRLVVSDGLRAYQDAFKKEFSRCGDC